MPVLESILIIRSWEESNLPLAQSALAYDLVTVIARSTISGKRLTINNLLKQLSYSETGVRKQLQRFIKTEWVRIDQCLTDKRIRYVTAEDKLLSALKAYAQIRRAPLKAPPS
jgi:DNA-binding MarR family transcriptional regulator